MRVYALSRDPMMPNRKVPPAKVPTLASLRRRKPPMSRRPIALLVLAIASFVLSACTSVTAPTTSNDCRGGFIGSDGRCSS